jgi:hypothetical protein
MAKLLDRKVRALRATYRADPLERKKAWIRDAAIEFLRGEVVPETDAERSALARAAVDQAVRIWDQAEARLTVECVDQAARIWDQAEARLTVDPGNGGDEDG